MVLGIIYKISFYAVLFNRSEFLFTDREVVLEDIKSHRSGDALTLEEYVIWTVHNNISMDFLDLIYQVRTPLVNICLVNELILYKVSSYEMNSNVETVLFIIIECSLTKILLRNCPRSLSF